MSNNNDLNREKVPTDAASSGGEFQKATTQKTFLVILVEHFLTRNLKRCAVVIGKLYKT